MFWTSQGQNYTLSRPSIAPSSHLLLPSLEQVTVVQENRLHLVDTPGRHEDEVEDGKHAELEIEGAVTDHPECEPAEKGRKYVQVDLIPDVIL